VERKIQSTKQKQKIKIKKVGSDKNLWVKKAVQNTHIFAVNFNQVEGVGERCDDNLEKEASKRDQGLMHTHKNKRYK